MKEKAMYIGIGLAIGVGIGFLSFSKITFTNIGNIDKLIINKQPMSDTQENSLSPQ